jgi:hypothetical protein
VTLIQTLEADFQVAASDIVTFLRNDAWPFVMTVFKDVGAAELKVVLPMVENAFGELAASAPALLTNPAALGGLFGSLVASAGTAAVPIAVSTVALAFSAALGALDKKPPAAQ